MELDVLGLLGACSYALDCVEAELVHVTTFHAKRVAYMCVRPNSLVFPAKHCRILPSVPYCTTML